MCVKLCVKMFMQREEEEERMINAAWKSDVMKLGSAVCFQPDTNEKPFQVHYMGWGQEAFEFVTKTFEFEGGGTLQCNDFDFITEGTLGCLSYKNMTLPFFIVLDDFDFNGMLTPDAITALVHDFSRKTGQPVYKPSDVYCQGSLVTHHQDIQVQLSGNKIHEICWAENVPCDPLTVVRIKNPSFIIPSGDYEKEAVPIDRVHMCTNPMYAVISMDYLFEALYETLTSHQHVLVNNGMALPNVVNGKACLGDVIYAATKCVPGLFCSDESSESDQEVVRNEVLRIFYRILEEWAKRRLQMKGSQFLETLGTDERESASSVLTMFTNHMFKSCSLLSGEVIAKCADILFPIYGGYDKNVLDKLFRANLIS